MTMIRLTDVTQYQALVERYRRPGCLSNDYLQARIASLIANGSLYALCCEDNVFLLERKDTCYRVYYYINDLSADEQPGFPDTVVTEILYRGVDHFPTREVAYLEQLGFERNLIRDQYAATFTDLYYGSARADGMKIQLALTLDEVDWACRLFNAAFDMYSGDYIHEREYEGLLRSGNILLAMDNCGGRLGALHQTVERNVAWISHVVVVPEARGKHVGQALLDAFIERNHMSDKSRYLLWVQQQNQAAVGMYTNTGFKYINKSSLSLIRK